MSFVKFLYPGMWGMRKMRFGAKLAIVFLVALLPMILMVSQLLRQTLADTAIIRAEVDGVVVVEREQLPALLPLAAHKVQAEAKRIAAIKTGDTAAKWLTASLVTAGVLKEGEVL